MTANGNRPNLIKNLIYLVLIILVCVSIFYTYNNGTLNSEKILYTQFESMLNDGEITDVYAIGTNVYVLTEKAFENLDDNQIKKVKEAFHKNGKYAIYNTESPSYVIVQELVSNYNEKIRNDNSLTEEQKALKIVTGNYEAQKEPIIWTILPYLSIIGLGVLVIIIIKSINQANNKNISFGKANTNTIRSKVKFSDVAGADEEKQELQELVEFLRDSKKFQDIGAKTPKGVLLVGPPGTGKTLLAKAVAGECNAPFFSISGSDFVEMFIGVGASRVRDLFAKAKAQTPSIIFIDEIDAVGRQRGAGLGGGNDEREQTLNQLLVELDGFEQNTNIIVIAATNRPDVLDPALLRPGRFDRQIYVNLPDVKGREEILKVHSKGKKFSSDVDFKVIAKITAGFSGADLANLLNEAAILTARDDRLSITMVDITESINKVIMGPQKRSHIITERDKKITAYHESGHAILHKLLEYCDEVQEVSIIPRGMAGGYTMSRPEKDDLYMSYNKLNDEIVAFMGGRVAEELIFKDVSTGASNDIQQATKIAKKMVTQYGMSKLGFINFGSESEVFIGRDYMNQTSYSEKTASLIDDEISNIINSNYKRAVDILSANIDKLHNMVKLLLEKETIYTEQVDMIMNDIPLEDIIKSIDDKIAADKEIVENERRKQQEQENIEKQKNTEMAILELAKIGCGIKINETDENGNNVVKDVTKEVIDKENKGIDEEDEDSKNKQITSNDNASIDTEENDNETDKEKEDK